jgi:zinc protease
MLTEHSSITTHYLNNCILFDNTYLVVHQRYDMIRFYFNKLIFLFLFFGYSQYAFAQDQLSAPIPLDSRVLTGKLDNGLTYYIQHNPKPENKVELRLVVNAGSVLEKEGQEGLAHFTEHMAFNGSRNFKKNELVSYLQSIGVAFGQDLNAYTGFDETVYILPIPSKDEKKLRSGFLVMADWAGGLTMDDEDINSERNIILEEWRTGQGYEQRLRDRYLPQLLYNSRYATRLPIGKIEVVQSFEPERLREFYRDWYRPDNMAVIAVGDVDTAKLLDLVTEYFGSLQNPEQPLQRTEFEVPFHKETFVSILQDAEAPGIQIQLFYKHPPQRIKTEADIKNQLIRTFYGGMLSQRLDEIRQKPNPPFIFAGAGYGDFVRNLDYFSVSGVVSSGKAVAGITAMLTENERVARFGFTQQELDRVKKSVLNSVERSYREMDKVESRAIVNRYINHFLQDKPAEGEEWRYQNYQKIIPGITLHEVNALASQLVRDENRVVIITASDTELDLPTAEEVMGVFEYIASLELEPYEEKELRESLLAETPFSGSIQKEEFHEAVAVTELILSNGVKVLVKSTDFKNDEIIFQASGKGGVSLYGDEDHYSASYAGVMVNVMGIGDFSPTDLRKLLSGKTVSVTPNIGTYTQNIRGTASPKDFETALQLIHLYFTQPRKDQELFEIYIQNQKTQLESAKANPDFQFSRQLNSIIANGNLRAKGIYDAEDLDKIDINRALEIYKERFSNAADFEFVFTGNLNLDSVKPMLETYLGSLPGDRDQLSGYKDLGIRAPQDKQTAIRVGSDDKSQVILYFSGERTYDRQESLAVTFLGEILTIKLIETLREEIGGVYGVGASGGTGKLPVDNFTFSVGFPCSPDRVEELIGVVWKEIEKLKTDGPSEDDLNKVKEKQRLATVENLKRNGFWNSMLANYSTNRIPFEAILDWESSIDKLSAAGIQQLARELLVQKNLLEIRKYPANHPLQP